MFSLYLRSKNVLRLFKPDTIVGHIIGSCINYARLNFRKPEKKKTSNTIIAQAY